MNANVSFHSDFFVLLSLVLGHVPLLPKVFFLVKKLRTRTKIKNLQFALATCEPLLEGGSLAPVVAGLGDGLLTT